ncbi:golgin subfamily A member 2-like isoform X2 [Mizuhopecten yessoensis]|uniref:Golgin subfamily A member 2 n=1 Tax=Mizuhopecten yessoensis TaxID=6573 RepID=A0A210QP81_MIZYE|nr:golgin subfamily A member 2-like isoform X2 [Mizuhopecten yessoensis]OWF50521.1 Golgin subfamily A member 2 [Mizuhopecten yessoensis]
MADSAKREKIAAARKKLKQFKQKTGKNSPVNPKTSNKQSDKKSKSNSAETDLSQENHSEPINTDPVINNTDQVLQDNSYSKQLTADTQQIIPDARTSASTESLQQLSRQLNGLLTESTSLMDTTEEDNANIVELERRNRELASLLEKHSEANEQLNIQVQQAREHAKALQDQVERERSAFDGKQRQEIGPLKEQLQVHIQTIGILVAEKTELQSQLNQSQKIAEQRFKEIEEYSGRLKASRQRVADLERDFSTSNNSSKKFEQNSKDFSKDVDRLKLELYKSNKTQEDLKQQCSELVEKLQAKASESTAMEQKIGDLTKRLEMSELYTQQLSSQGDSKQESLAIMDQLQREKELLASQVQEYSEAFQKACGERDQVADQYKSYIDQLQQHSQQLTEQVTSLTEEREVMVTQQHQLEASIQQLQQQLEDVNANQHQQQETNVAMMEREREIDLLQKQHQDLQQQHDSQIRDNSQLSRLLEEKEARILELENDMSEMGMEASDKAQLLDSIQSNKTALSRALTQNKDLKSQLAELQNGFVKLSNDNMELMTKVQSEQHSSQEHLCRLSQQEDNLKDLRETMMEKDLKLAELKHTTHEVTKEQYHHEQINDRMRHYEAQAQLVETLQRELQNSQDMTDALKTQNCELRTMLIKASDNQNNPGLNPEDEKKRDDVIDSLTAAIKQLETERTQLMQTLKEQRDLSDSLTVKITDLEEAIVQKSTFHVDNDKVSRQEYDVMRKTMQMIEDKYTGVMRDKAELSDKAEQLEHLVLQLEGEADTIGEYISLYHHQRALLQQREYQKNDYIAHLAKDREQLQEKLGELQQLVMQLLGEKNMLSNYHEEAHTSMHSNDLSVQPHIQNALQPLTNGVNSNDVDWPDYTSSESDSESEVEAIVGGQDNFTNKEVTETMDQPTEHQTTHHHHQHHHHRHHSQTSHDEGHVHTKGPQEGQTANKILNLLTEIGHSTLVDRPNDIDHNFLPCKYCKGKVQII